MDRKEFLEMVQLGQTVRIGITGEEVVGQVKETGTKLVTLQTSDSQPRRILYADIQSVQLASASSRCSSLVAEA